MTENKQFEPERFEPDCNKNNNQYDYSILNSRYEANLERNEIIEWNKDSCNAQYVGLERIAERMNFKQMQLEECRKRYEKLYEENEQLKQTNSNLNDIVLFQKGIVDDWEIEEIEIGMKILCDLYFSVRKEKEQLEQRIKRYEE